MPLDRLRSNVVRAVALCISLAPSVALAGKLDVSIDEHDGGAVVRIRSDETSIAQPDVARSKTGLLLFFPGETVEARRIYSKAARLRYVQTGTARGKAAVRIVQRPGARGSIREFAHLRPVPGGYEVEVVDSYPAAPETKPAPAGDAPAPLNDAAAADGAAAATARPPSPTDTRHDDTDRRLLLERLADAPAPPHDETADPPVASEPAVAAAAEEAAAPTPDDDGTDPAPAEANDADVDDTPLFAGEGDAPTAAEAAAIPTTGPSSLTTYTFGAACLLFGGAGLWWLGRTRKRRAGAVEVRERIQIGPKQSVVCMRVAGRDLLIGATEHNVALLAEFASDGTAGTQRPVVGASPSASAPQAAPEAPPPSADSDAKHRLEAFKRRLAAAMEHTPTATATPKDADEDAARIEFSVPTRDPAWVRHREVA